jgi:hypothetical protein
MWPQLAISSEQCDSRVSRWRIAITTKNLWRQPSCGYSLCPNSITNTDKFHHDNTCGILSVKLLRCCSSNWPRESSWETKLTPNNVHPSWSPSQDSQSMKTCYHLHHHHHYPILLELAHNWSLCRWQPSP